MDSEGEETIEHMTHHHPLVYVAAAGGSEDFGCDGCNRPGNGSRYQCTACNFVLHHHCATCPHTFSFVSHHLKLLSDADLRPGFLVCDVCHNDIDGPLFYRCEKCKFDVHPLCTQLPEQRSHRMHPDHLSKLQQLSHGTCSLCKTLCDATSWGYTCRICDFNVHLSCAFKSPSRFLLELKSPITIFLVVILAILVLMFMGTKDQRKWAGYSVHSAHFHR